MKSKKSKIFGNSKISKKFSSQNTKKILLSLILIVVISSFSLSVIASAVQDDLSDCNLWCRIKYLFTGKIDITGGAVIDETQETGLVSMWHMDEAAGASTITDSAGANDGTVNGATSGVAGKYGNALSFDGDADYVSVGNDASLLTTRVTVEAWIYPTNIAAQPIQDIVSKHNGGTAIRNYLLRMGDGVTANGQLMFLVRDSTDSAWHTATFPINATNNKWYHVVGTFNGSEVQIYVNGVAGTPASYVGDMNTGDNAPLTIGAYTGNPALEEFSGLIDEVAIYNRALSAEEIAAQAADVPTCGESHTAGLVSYWKADGDASDAYDGNDGTLMNGATATAAGQVGQAFSFDGVDDYVDVPDSADLKGMSQLTVEAWINPQLLDGSSRGVIGKNNVAANRSYHININPSNSITFSVFNDANIEGYVTDPNALSTNDWYYVVGTYDGSYVRLYINSVLIGEGTLTGTVRSTTAPLWVGRLHDYFFNGMIDEAAVYNRALTPDEINQHYINGLNSQQYCTPPQPFVPTCGENHTTDMVSYWKADGDASDAYDGNDGTLMNGATFDANGIVGQAFSFDGVDDYVEVADSDSLDLGTLTVEAWVYLANPDATVAPSQVIAGKFNPADTKSGYLLFYHNTDKDFKFQGGDGTTWAVMNVASAVHNTPGWYHIVATNDGTTAKIYVNGVEEGSGAGATLAGDTMNLWIGDHVYNGAGGGPWEGSIDEVAIYNRSLTADEINQHYINGLNNKPYCAPVVSACPSDAVAVWQLDETTGTTASDETGNGNDGTLVNGPVWTTGLVDGALSFDGVDDYVEVADSDNLDLTGSFTVSLWVYLNSASDDWEHMLSKYNSAGDPDGWALYYHLSRAHLVFQGQDINGWGSSGLSIESDTTLNAGQWYYITITYDKDAATKGYFYINAVDHTDRVDSTDGGPILASTMPVYIGKGGPTYAGINGSIDEVAIYNRSLTATEIADNYNAGLGKHICTAGAPPTAVCNDTDGDGFGTGADLSACTGSTTLADCDDTDALINPDSGCACLAKTDCTAYCWGTEAGNYTCHSAAGNSVLPSITYAPAAENCASCYTDTTYQPNYACIPQWTTSQQYCYQSDKYGSVCDASQPCVNGDYCANDNTFKTPVVS